MKIPSICFPKGIKEKYEEFNKIVKPNGISLDPEIVSVGKGKIEKCRITRRPRPKNIT